jgi:hypothetical protein
VIEKRRISAAFCGALPNELFSGKKIIAWFAQRQILAL